MLQIHRNKGIVRWRPGPTVSLSVVTFMEDGAFGLFTLREDGDRTDSEEHAEK